VHRQIVCPACGEAEELTGQPGPDGIQITCDTCGAAWPRDAALVRCATCGGTDVTFRPQPLTAYSRGTQVSIVGWRHVPLCASCDAGMLDHLFTGKPLPTGYISAAAQRQDPGSERGGNYSILPR
jgi:hypothetical protein